MTKATTGKAKSILGIIPARLAASRFPNKPMARILGMPMIGHVYHRSRLCPELDEVWVATPDREIHDYVVSIGGRAVMTADTHKRASDRTAEALVNIERLGGLRVGRVAMIQGDEPMLDPAMITQLIAPVLDDPDLKITNLIAPIDTDEDFNDSKIVKVVLDRNDFALYFSREPIPSKKLYKGTPPRWKQLGIILFERDALLEYIALPPTPLEVVESVDMNRLLEHGRKIKMVRTEFRPCGVDVPADLAYVEGKLKDDPIVRRYMK